MSISQVQKTSAAPGATLSSTATFSTAPTNNNLLVGIYRAQTPLANMSIPAGWSTAVSIEGSSSLVSLIIAYKVAAGDGTGVTFTTSASVNQDLAIAEYSGVAATSPLDKTASAASAGTANSQASGTTATTAQADELLIVGLGLNGGGGGFANTWTNSFVQQAALVRSTWAHRIVSATGAFTTTEAWTTTQRAAAAIATFKAIPVRTTTARVAAAVSLPSVVTKHGVAASRVFAAVSLPSSATKHAIAASAAAIGVQPTGVATKHGTAAAVTTLGITLTAAGRHIATVVARAVVGVLPTAVAERLPFWHSFEAPGGVSSLDEGVAGVSSLDEVTMR